MSLGLAVGALPKAEQLAAEEVSLPMYAELTDADVSSVLEAVRAACHELF